MRQIRFADFDLDFELFTLRRGGAPVDIGRRTLDLLVCLIQNRDRVVDTEFLRREVWESAALSSAAIPTCIRELRRALGDDASSPRFIESKRGRGYRFISEIENVSAARCTRIEPFEEFPFVGRQAEMDTLHETVRSSLAEARFNLILIRGEAGMGKTRTLTEFLKALPNEIPHYMAHGSTVEGTPAFWPWTKILREALAAQKGTNQQLLENAQSLSTAFPEIQHSVDPAHEGVTNLDRFSILSHWARTIRSISRNAPLVLALEDLHRADFSSLALIKWISEELSFDPVVIIATHRPSIETSTAAQGLSEIASLPRCTSVDLSPLTAEDISCLLDPLSVDRATLSEALRSRTMGNAFYVTHLIRFIDARPQSESTAALVSALPSSGKEIVARQLSDLPDDTRDALAVASVAGRFFSVDTTAEILGIDNTKLLARLEPARLGWIIREEGRQFEFSHALLQEALYHTIDSSRRREIHLRLARHLIEQSDSHSSLISDHLLKAIPLAEPSEARSYAVQAGRDAATRFAYSEAQTFFRRALDLLDSDPECTPTIRCDILLEYANAQLYAGDRESARRTLLDAANLARQADSPQLLAACALQLAPDYLSIEVGAYDLTLIHLTEEAIDATPDSDISTRSKLLSRLSQAIEWVGAQRRRQEIVTEALHLARQSQDVKALSAALSAQADFLGGIEVADERIQVLSELRRATQFNDNIPAKLVHHTRMIAALLEVGDFAKLDAENEACRELASKTNLAHFMWYPESTDSMRALMRGNINQDRTLTDRYQEIQHLSPDSNVSQGYASQEFYRQIELDHSESVIPLVLEFTKQNQLVLSWSASLCWLHWDADLLPDATNLLSHFDHTRIDNVFRERGGGIGIAMLSEVSAHLGETHTRRYLYDRVLSILDRRAAAGFGVLYFGSFSRYAGLLALSLGMFAEAIGYLEQAIKDESIAGARVWQGHSEVDLAWALYEAGESSKRVAEATAAAFRTVNATDSARLKRRYLTLMTKLH